MPEPHTTMLPAPPLHDYVAFLDWLMEHFSAYISENFEYFVVKDLQVITLSGLSHFLESENSVHLYQVLGPSQYDFWRLSLINLKIIWSFIKRSFPSRNSTVPFAIFPKYRDVVYSRYNTLMPASQFLEQPHVRPETELTYSHLFPKSGKWSRPDSAYVPPCDCPRCHRSSMAIPAHVCMANSVNFPARSRSRYCFK